MGANTSYPVVPVPLTLTPLANAVDVFRINIAAGTRSVSVGTFSGDATSQGIWLGSAAPGNTNYTLANFSGGVVLNATTSVAIRINGSFSPVALSVDTTGCITSANIKLWASGGLAVGSANVATDPGANNILGTVLRQITSSTPTNGQTVTLGDNTRDQVANITPAGTLATLTVAFPTNTNSTNGQRTSVYISQIITTITFTSTGATFPNAPAAWAAGEIKDFVKLGTTWVLVT